MEKTIKQKVTEALAIIGNIGHRNKLEDLGKFVAEISRQTKAYKLESQVFSAPSFNELCGHVARRNYQEATKWADVLLMFLEALISRVDVRYAHNFTHGTERIVVIQSLKSQQVIAIELSQGIKVIS